MPAALGLALVAVAAVAPAQERVELTSGVQQSLLYVQEQWIQWLSALGQADEERADEVMGDLMVVTRQLGMEALPDLATAARARAVEYARAEDFERADIALRASERFDPGRPENAFARATVERLRGHWLDAAMAAVEGHLRRLRLPRERRLWLFDLGIEALYALLLAGGLFVALTMIVSGPRLHRDLASLLPRVVPSWSLSPLVLVLLLWPLLLPAGVAWLTLYLSMLLWSYCNRRERAVLAIFWLVAALTPFAVAHLREKMTIAMAPPVRVLDELGDRRLYGAMFADLGLLRALLPEEPAVEHLLADVHRRLGDWERARILYLQVLEQEPDNAAALVDLGAYFFYKKDEGSARQRFVEATEVDPDYALAYFNLNQAYLLSMLYSDAGEALRQAQRLAGPEMRRFMDETEEGSLLEANGGLARRGEIRDRLEDVLRVESGGRIELLRQAWSLLVVVGFAVSAILFHAVRRRWAEPGRAAPPPAFASNRWVRLVVPGLDSVQEGNGFVALSALLFTVVLFMIPLGDRLGFSSPLSYVGGQGTAVLAVAGLVLFYAVRGWWLWRQEG